MVVTGTPAIPTVSHTAISALVNAGATPIMGLTPYDRGAAYNQLFAYVLPASNRSIQYFDLVLSLLDEPTSVETYTNLRLRAVATKEEQVDMNRLNNSAIAEWTVPDLTAVTDRTPLSAIFAFEGGTNGGTITAADYIGSNVSKTGFNAFDIYGDMTVLATLDKSILDVAITQAGATYVNNRKDLVYMAHVDNSLTNENTINAAIDALAIDSSYVGFYGGGNKTTNPDTAAKIQISELGDILGLVAYTHKNFGFHYSFAGVNRGVIPNSTGPVNNFGEIGQKPALDALAQNRVNMVILRNKKVYLKGNFTAQVALSPLSFMSIRFFLNGLKKALAPNLENYQEEPCEPSTWLKLYYEIRPYMETLADKKALHGKEGIGWRWDGDQFVTNLNDLAVNNANDVGLGKYKVRLFVKPVNSIQEIEVSIIITPGGVTFEEAAALL
jgi:phage tail sheath protein FI